MKLLRMVLLLCVLSIIVNAQGPGPSFPKGSLSGPTMVASLPTTHNSNILYDVRDANSATDCTVGGGSTRIVCKWNGSAYAVVGGAGGTPTAITVANEATDTTTFPLFVTSATGDLGPKTNASFTFNSNTGELGVASIATTGAGPLIITALEGSAPSGVANNDVLYGDSTAHRLKVNNNNGGATTLSLFTDNLSVFAAGGAIAPASGNFSGALTVATALNSCADAGANDTYACSLSPAPAGYTTGQIFWFKANTANTGVATVNFNSLGAKTIVKLGGGITTALADNDIRAGQYVAVQYDGTNMQMLSQLGNAPSSGFTIGDTQVAFADGANTPAGDAGMTYNKTTDSLTLGTRVTVNNTGTYTGGTDPAFTVGAVGSATGIHNCGGAVFVLCFVSSGSTVFGFNGATANMLSTGVIAWVSSGAPFSSAENLGISKKGAGILAVGAGSTAGNTNGSIQVKSYLTDTNCTDSAGAAACGSASAGSVVIDAGSTSVVVSTTSVTANSQITPVFDSSLGTRLGVTCNTTAALPVITARTAGTSFTITVAVAPITNPACFSYSMVN